MEPLFVQQLQLKILCRSVVDRKKKPNQQSLNAVMLLFFLRETLESLRHRYGTIKTGGMIEFGELQLLQLMRCCNLYVEDAAGCVFRLAAAALPRLNERVGLWARLRDADCASDCHMCRLWP